jgi:uncharacterized protein YlxP (DUF503 family)
MNQSSIKNLLFPLLLTWIALTLGAHPFYLSVCEMDYNPGSNRLEIAIKFFSDDITNAIKEATGKKLYLGEERELDSADEELDQYLKRRLTVWVNGKPLSFSFIGKEIIDDVTWCYVESETLPEIESLKVRNQVLMEMFETQKNIIHITVKDKKKSLLLQRGKEEGTIEL